MSEKESVVPASDGCERITYELREWAKALGLWWYDPEKNEYTYTTGRALPSLDAIRLDEHILAIADRIDAAHAALEESVEHYRTENAKLRKLARLLLWGVDNDMPRDEGLVWSQKVDVLTRELGIEEVDE